MSKNLALLLASVGVFTDHDYFERRIRKISRHPQTRNENNAAKRRLRQLAARESKSATKKANL